MSHNRRGDESVTKAAANLFRVVTDRLGFGGEDYSQAAEDERAAQRELAATYGRPRRFARWAGSWALVFLGMAIGGMVLWGLIWLAWIAFRFLLRLGGFL